MKIVLIPCWWSISLKPIFANVGRNISRCFIKYDYTKWFIECFWLVWKLILYSAGYQVFESSLTHPATYSPGRTFNLLTAFLFSTTRFRMHLYNFVVVHSYLQFHINKSRRHLLPLSHFSLQQVICTYVKLEDPNGCLRYSVSSDKRVNFSNMTYWVWDNLITH